jgi:hypothetical protein
MSDTINPYESTQTDLDEQKPLLVSQGSFSSAMIAHLKAASPWMKFMGITSFIGSGMLIIVGILIFLFPIFGEELDLTETFLSGIINSAFGFFYLAYGVVSIFPAKFLYSFASKIKLFIKTKNESDMESALRNNKSFWKFYGIMAIVVLAFFPIIFIVSIVIGIVGYAM